MRVSGVQFRSGRARGPKEASGNQRTLGDMIMRKNTLLIAVAAAALAVGSGTAFSQGMQGGHKADSPAAQSNPASKNAPAEKIQGQGADHRGAKETTGQGASDRGQKMGQDSKEPKGNKSTTGQAPSEPKSGQA